MDIQKQLRSIIKDLENSCQFYSNAETGCRSSPTRTRKRKPKLQDRKRVPNLNCGVSICRSERGLSSNLSFGKLQELRCRTKSALNLIKQTSFTFDEVVSCNTQHKYQGTMENISVEDRRKSIPAIFIEKVKTTRSRRSTIHSSEQRRRSTTKYVEKRKNSSPSFSKPQSRNDENRISLTPSVEADNFVSDSSQDDEVLPEHYYASNIMAKLNASTKPEKPKRKISLFLRRPVIFDRKCVAEEDTGENHHLEIEANQSNKSDSYLKAFYVEYKNAGKKSRKLSRRKTKSVAEETRKRSSTYNADEYAQLQHHGRSKSLPTVEQLKVPEPVADFTMSHSTSSMNGSVSFESLSSREGGSVDSDYGAFDIVGETNTSRFPWLRDVMTQCEPLRTVEKSVQTDSFLICDHCGRLEMSRCGNVERFRKNGLFAFHQQAGFEYGDVELSSNSTPKLRRGRIKQMGSSTENGLNIYRSDETMSPPVSPCPSPVSNFNFPTQRVSSNPRLVVTVESDSDYSYHEDTQKRTFVSNKKKELCFRIV
ncbi:uncharacterized protein LOC117125280 [Anneissia japonica]|uniref:uncharacterized protein LOC117125280 n=1 Tax=Anneissia japonica TaxID=1529436 RepID=UPI001425866B|nr:uncharacterized protein LOC117125280 [Anneissia japonica]